MAEGLDLGGIMCMRGCDGVMIWKTEFWSMLYTANCIRALILILDFFY